MFIDSRGHLIFFSDKKFHLQANYYKQMRKNELLLEDNKPIGGNGALMKIIEKAPSGYEIPKLPTINPIKISEISNL